MHPPGHLLVDGELRALLGEAVRSTGGAPPVAAEQVQPSSLDLRLGAVAHRIRAGFLPGERPIEERLGELAISALPLEGPGAVLERGLIYLVPLEEELDLPDDVRGRFNPRSSTGRCDIFTRVLCPGHPRFDEAPAGFRGRLWLEIAPLSFPVRLKRGDRLCQLRLQRGRASLTTDELRALYRETPLCFEGGTPTPLERVRFDDSGGLLLSLGLSGRDPAGWRASSHTDVVEFARSGAHDPREFWEPVHAPGGRCILAPGCFYLFASRERLRIPPGHAAEMLPVDVGMGELRNNYAGFFDNGFGWREDGPELSGGTSAVLPAGTPAVLEVRAHDVAFQVEDGQVFFRLRFFKSSRRPDELYGVGRREEGPGDTGGSYANQDLTLARAFRPL